MKLINQSVEFWEQPEGEVGIYKQVERAARLCYKSEDKTTEDSYKKFIGMLNDKGHNSPFEHGTVYLLFGENPYSKEDSEFILKYKNNPYSKVIGIGTDDTPVDSTFLGDKLGEGAYGCFLWAITTNFRVIKEHGWEDDLKYLCEPTEYHEKRISVHITTSIGISRELNRHRCHSICEESTRYCNYSKDKFDNTLAFILPNWIHISDIHLGEKLDIHPMMKLLTGQYDRESMDIRFLVPLAHAAHTYKCLIANGYKPQQARDVLPLATKTELIHTAFESDWKEFFKLRCSSAAHPMMQELANQIKELIQNYK